MPISRRNFLLVSGGASAAAATAGGSKLVNKLIPYVNPPQNALPGEWASYASTCRECPAGCGVRARHVDGRVTKTEGNRTHPLNRGGLCPRGQSSVQGLYDPDRMRTPLRREGKNLVATSWDEAMGAVSAALAKGGSGRLAVISDLQTGSLLEAMQGLMAASRSSRLLLYEPFSSWPLRKAHGALFGSQAVPSYHLEKAEMVVSFGSDFLESGPSPVEHARAFSSMHGYDNGVGRFVHVGPRLSMTAANADDFLQVGPGEERWVALAMLKAMAREGMSGAAAGAWSVAEGAGAAEADRRCSLPAATITALARQFVRHRGLAMATSAGDDGAAAADAAFAAGLLNVASGSINTSVDFSRRHAAGRCSSPQQVQEFLDTLTAEDVLLIHNVNVAFTLPGAVDRLRRPRTVVYLGFLPDETAELADWVLPLDSPLEAWGEYEPVTGIHSLMQPAMARLHDTRNAGDIFIQLAGGSVPFAQKLRQRWEGMKLAGGFDAALQEGWISQGVPPVSVRLQDSARQWRFAPPAPPLKASEGVLVPWSSIMLHDGRTANRGWLQEAPDPVTTAAWGNWADIHPEKAKLLHLADGDVIELSTSAGSVSLPARITEEIHPAAVAACFGQGHTAAGLTTASGIGANLSRVAGAGVVQVKKGEKRQGIVYLSATRDQHRRRILRTAEAEALRRMEVDDADPITLPLPQGYDAARDLYPPHEHRKRRWGMVIDLQKCIGCGACAVACYAENNVAVVGRRRAGEGREMAWLKVVPYEMENKPHRLRWLPMLCQHCDCAPCEPVCPVFAAVHNEEGLNAQVYNRCIGTRYCSNNCPYKVRRFNWLSPEWKGPQQLQLNPEVTVRSRGVMEKCTFCVQRIRQADYRARLEGRPLRDGEAVPACAESCPTGAYTFGDLMDPASRVSQLVRNDPRRYQVLHELNTKPAVIYLKGVDLGPLTGEKTP
ncbi:MAG TPA: molybdopterin-dependent oxidoreductase [Verrucomicrobiae bacterium]|nr:molybdopterin-dependent oxidoreductase [Verrucomicrobiae bacterium]